MIQDCPPILEIFYKQFNSRLNTLDFINNLGLLIDILNNKENKELIYSIILPCEDSVQLNQLISFRFDSLLDNIIKNIKIEEESKDNYLSEMDNELLLIYEKHIKLMIKRTTVVIDYKSNYFRIKCDELFMNLFVSPFSQLHTEVIIQLEHSIKMLEVATIPSEFEITNTKKHNLFLNSKHSTSYSYFILAFIAENLNIPLKV